MDTFLRQVILLSKYLCTSLGITSNLDSICKAFIVIHNLLTFDCNCRSFLKHSLFCGCISGSKSHEKKLSSHAELNTVLWNVGTLLRLKDPLNHCKTT